MNLQETVRGTPPPDKRLLEHHFVFACIWAFGGTMLVDKVSDYRLQFSKWWVSEWKAVPFPEKVRCAGHLTRRGCVLGMHKLTGRQACRALSLTTTWTTHKCKWCIGSSASPRSRTPLTAQPRCLFRLWKPRA